ncbi:single-pass membrane and coiled-coil domain-containing 3-like protein [Labeo rohita]|uniref:Single-pass membrane and coiled-coil domain-containing 3-like protein n=1 Tax=Labeo rohita TaxID=84645 RepID=A0A498N0M5_LABRO|nr:single-pass membrane and coiled-coil domain-containing 3-like protein [Labeo rohita]
MNWSDIFYPGNPERREKLIRKNQELLNLMENNFRATNQLTETLKKHLGWSFSLITLNEKATVKENCDVIIECIHEIQAEVEKIDMQLKEKLEPTLYEKLRNENLSVHDYQIFRKAVYDVCGVGGSASIVAVNWLIKNGTILANITSSFAKFATGLAAGVALGVVFMGIDMIIGAILGSIERNELEKALKDHIYHKFTVKKKATRMLSLPSFAKKDELKKEELIRSTQILHHYVHKYFNITNRLLVIFNTHLEQSPSPAVSANESESIEKNCTRVRDVMRLILDASEREDKHVRKSTEPALYGQIALSGVSQNVKAAVIKDLHQETLGLLGNVFGPLVTVRLANSDLESVMPPVEQCELQSVLSLALEELVQSSARIGELLCKQGNQQRSLDEAIVLVEDVLSVLKPPCDSYNDILSEVEAYVTIISENI